MFVHDGLLVGAPLLGAGVLVYPDSGPPITWSVDATSGKGVPADATEWANIISDQGLTNWTVPDSVYSCQDSASPLVDDVGAIDLAFGGSGATYQQAITGWSRLAATLADSATAGWSNASGGLPDIGTASCLLLAFVRMPTTSPGSARQIVTLGSSGYATIRIIQTSGILQVVSNTIGGSGATNMIGAGVVPLVLKVDQTANQVIGYSPSEKLGPAFSASMTGQGVKLGASVGNCPNSGFLYAARWDGAAAERSDADIKALLEALGWTVTGY